jgi:Domain of unknown function (DUF1877)
MWDDAGRAIAATRTGGSGMALGGIIHVITLQDFEAACRGDSWRLRPGVASVELEIYWHVIHYLVTGNANFAFLQSGVQIHDSGEGIFEVHSPQDVAALHARLSTKSAAELMSKFDTTKFDELRLYRGRWAVPTDVSEPYTFKVAEESDRWLRDEVEKVLVRFVSFVQHAAKEGMGFYVEIL